MIGRPRSQALQPPPTGELSDELVQATLRAAVRVARTPLPPARFLPPPMAWLVSEALEALDHRWEGRAPWPTAP